MPIVCTLLIIVGCCRSHRKISRKIMPQQHGQYHLNQHHERTIKVERDAGLERPWWAHPSICGHSREQCRLCQHKNGRGDMHQAMLFFPSQLCIQCLGICLDSSGHVDINFRNAACIQTGMGKHVPWRTTILIDILRLLGPRTLNDFLATS